MKMKTRKITMEEIIKLVQITKVEKVIFGKQDKDLPGFIFVTDRVRTKEELFDHYRKLQEEGAEIIEEITHFFVSHNTLYINKV